MQLLGSGTILREVIAAADLLDADFGIKADIWSCPSFTELARDGVTPSAGTASIRKPRPAQGLDDPAAGRPRGPAIAATDYIRTFANQIREYVPMRCSVLGTDGCRPQRHPRQPAPPLRVDRFHVAHAAVAATAADGKLTAKDVARAIKLYKLDAEKRFH